MKHSKRMRIRPMIAADVARLSEIDADFESPIYLEVLKEGDGLNVTWHLIERSFETAFVSDDYAFDEKEQALIRERLEMGDGMWLVIENGHSGRLVGMIDVIREAWRNAGFVWNIAIDRVHRDYGLGHELMARVIKWGRRKGLRAIILETQTNNWPACRFYQQIGFELTGIDDHYYTNHDVADKEVALFWTYEL
jgi:ribosomal protein S18 acetylase RimI-like enzyme